MTYIEAPKSLQLQNLEMDMNSANITVGLQNLSISASPANITIGVPTYVTFTVTSSGSATSAAIVIVTGAGINTDGMTNSAGQVTLQLTASNSSTINVVARKIGYFDTIIYLNIPPTICASISITTNLTTTFIGNTVILTATMLPVDTTLYLIVFKANGNIISKCITSTNGSCSANWDTTGLTAGTYNVTAEVTGQCMTLPIVMTLYLTTIPKKSLTVSETWNIDGTWSVVANSIDARASPKQAWLSLWKNGIKVNDNVLTVGNIYSYDVFSTNIYSIIAGATTDLVQLMDTTISGIIYPMPCLISVVSSSTTVSIGNAITLIASIQPITSTFYITFKDQNNNILGSSTSINGLATFVWNTTGKMAGTYNIKAYTDLCTSDPVTITLNSALTTITVYPSTSSILIGNTAQFIAICKDQNNNSMICPTLIWSSSNPSIAEVSSTGLVMGLAAGITNIIVSTIGITSNISTVTILATPILTSIEIFPSSTVIGTDSTQEFTTTCRDQYNNIMTCSTITWSGDDENIGTIDPNTGIFTAIAGGTVMIRATSGTIFGNATVVVVTTGDLYISSTPPGAKIFIDDVEQIGLTTPTTIYNLPPGNHNVKLTLSSSSVYLFDYRILSDYQWTETVNIIAGQMAIIDIVLIPITGDIEIISDPPRAKIIIDDTDTGKITPDTIMGLSPGTHLYKLTLSGYVNITGTFGIVAGQLAILSVKLDRAGYLYISSNPPGAKIYIDDIDLGLTTPSMIQDVSIGIHTYKLILTGYDDVTGSFDIIAGQITIVETELVPLELKGYLYISSIPLGAEIYIDNKDTGKVTPMIIPDLSPGNHNYKLTLPKYKDEIGTFDIISDQITVIYKELLKLSVGCQPFSSTPRGTEITINNINTGLLTPTHMCHYPIGTWPLRMDGRFELPKSGCITIDSVPRGLRIIIDGIDTGKKTPSRICNISAGIHTFRLEGTVSIK